MALHSPRPYEDFLYGQLLGPESLHLHLSPAPPIAFLLLDPARRATSTEVALRAE